MSRNPYLNESSAPNLQLSAFAFIDILGYSDLIREAEESGQQQALLERIHSALKECRLWLDDRQGPAELQVRFGGKDSYALKAFTDNIVIGWPIERDGEIELGEAFECLMLFQFDMALKGLFVRGGISIGDAFIDEFAVIGNALTAAHSAESKLARDPRIVLTGEAVKLTKQHLSAYGDQSWTRQNQVLLQDPDGQWFVNYLECIMIAEHEQGPFFENLMQHKQEVEKKLSAFKQRPAVWSKYAWVANYHNAFCDMYPHHFDNSHKINLELFRAAPRRIIAS
ncbi:MAG: hypothetical protein HZC25_09870 [Rhodospirillales bacterium]|nr:hypothetical protein [Rhodospirillales bacterium]